MDNSRVVAHHVKAVANDAATDDNLDIASALHENQLPNIVLASDVAVVDVKARILNSLVEFESHLTM